MKTDKSETESLIRRLSSPSYKIDMILDTDAYNEVDDQFAIAYALSCAEKLNIKAFYAAPFFNERSTGAADGMQKSYDEILRLLAKIKMPFEGRVLQGSKTFMQSSDVPVESPAAQDLIRCAHGYTPDNPLYVVAIGAITNIASAVLLDPSIISKIVIVWLGGQPLHWVNTEEFNLSQDVFASRIIFDCGAALVQIPCMGVASHLLTTNQELAVHIGGKSELCNTLTELFAAYADNHCSKEDPSKPYAKEIWDISTIAWLINPDWVPSVLDHSPVLNDNCTWSRDTRRHFYRCAYFVNRNDVFADMFQKIVRI